MTGLEYRFWDGRVLRQALCIHVARPPLSRTYAARPQSILRAVWDLVNNVDSAGGPRAGKGWFAWSVVRVVLSPAFISMQRSTVEAGAEDAVSCCLMPCILWQCALTTLPACTACPMCLMLPYCQHMASNPRHP
jgi:hypothetical protein